MAGTLGIPGSLRQESDNRAALRAAQQLVPDGAHLAGAVTRVGPRRVHGGGTAHGE